MDRRLFISQAAACIVGRIPFAKSVAQGPTFRDPFMLSLTKARQRNSSIPIPPVRAVPSVVRRIGGTVYYAGNMNGPIDKGKLEDDREASAGLTTFTNAVEGFSNAWIASGGRSPIAAERGCALLASWASQGALADAANEQGKAHMRWNTTGLAVAYLAMRHGAQGHPKAQIVKWMNGLGHRCLNGAKRYRNNHLYWAAAAAMCCAVASDDPPLFQRALDVAQRALASIRDDGSLPDELARGSRALGYHAFALAPLALMAELALANDRDLYRRNDRAIFRLSAFVARNIFDPAEVAVLSGMKQGKVLSPPCMRIVAKRMTNSQVRSCAAQSSREHVFLGGRVDLLFA